MGRQRRKAWISFPCIGATLSFSQLLKLKTALWTAEQLFSIYTVCTEHYGLFLVMQHEVDVKADF